MTLAATLPSNRDEEWRYADIPAVAALGADALDAWHEATLAPGEVRAKDLLLDDSAPGLHRVRLTVGAGARAELFAVISASSFTRLEVEVTLAEGAHFEFGAVTIGGADVVREAVTRVRHAEPSATSHQGKSRSGTELIPPSCNQGTIFCSAPRSCHRPSSRQSPH